MLHVHFDAAASMHKRRKVDQIFQSCAVQDKYLMDDLESWKSYAGDDTEPPRLAPIPPRLQLLQAKPFLLDCALDYIQAPDLSHRIPKEAKKSTIGRLFGWGPK